MHGEQRLVMTVEFFTSYFHDLRSAGANSALVMIVLFYLYKRNQRRSHQWAIDFVVKLKQLIHFNL